MRDDADLKLTLSALIASMGELSTAECARLLDAATLLAGTASIEVLDSLGADNATSSRLRAVRRLGVACGACGACGQCPRGRAEPVIAHPHRQGHAIAD